MPDERMCPHCGRSNPTAMPRCINCGQRVGGGLLLKQDDPTETQRSATGEPWWRTTAAPGSTIPLPPQIREEAARAEAVRLELHRRTEEERIATELRAAEQRKRAAEEAAWRQAQIDQRVESSVRTSRSQAPVQSKKSVQAICARCDTPVREAGAVFSFCLNCGADLANQAPTQNVSAARPVAHTMGGTVHQQMSHTVSVQPTVTRSGVNPMLPAVLSFFWPGVGQFVNGQAAKGILLLLASFVARRIFGWEPFGFLMILVGVLAAVDGFRIAERKRVGKPVREGEWDLG